MLRAALVSTLAILFSACSPAPKSDVLPASADVSAVESCACKERGNCIQLEQVAGRVEVRALRCEWQRTGYRATCRFETRFITTYPDF